MWVMDKILTALKNIISKNARETIMAQAGKSTAHKNNEFKMNYRIM